MIPKLLLIPLIVGLITQLSKFIWHAQAGMVNWRAVSFYGGMPSTHTAIMVSLTTVVGLETGITSAAFALACVVSLVVVRDAIGFRRYLGTHSRALNRMVRDLPATKQDEFEEFREQLGHTPLEAFVGGIMGFALSALFYLVIP